MKELFARPFKTPFDSMDFHIDIKQKGGAVRDRLLEFENELGRVAELATLAAHRCGLAEARHDLAWDLARVKVAKATFGDKGFTAIIKESMARTTSILLPGQSEETTPQQEIKRLLAYKYVERKGKDKVKELNSAIDLGRSVLSFDKEELSRLHG